MREEFKRVFCPRCGYLMPIRYRQSADCNGVSVKCKNKKCGFEFEIQISKGEQISR